MYQEEVWMEFIPWWCEKSQNRRYEISNRGRFKFCAFTNAKGNRTYKERITCGSDHSAGYKLISKVEGLNTLYIHIAVATTFIDNLYGLPQVNHKDGNKSNNNVENLEWVSYKENLQHARQVGLNKNRGENSPLSKLTDVQALEIYKRYHQGGVTQQALAKEYGMANQTISKLVNRQTYKHIHTEDQ